MVNEQYCICPWHEYGEHIRLQCKNHPNLRWSTKNIDFIGARTIFYDSNETECKCNASSLFHTCQDSEDYAKLND